MFIYISIISRIRTINGSLKVLRAHSTLNMRGVLVVLHFNIARLLVVAKRTSKDLVEWLRELLLRRRLSLTLSSCHNRFFFNLELDLKRYSILFTRFILQISTIKREKKLNLIIISPVHIYIVIIVNISCLLHSLIAINTNIMIKLE